MKIVGYRRSDGVIACVDCGFFSIKEYRKLSEEKKQMLVYVRNYYCLADGSARAQAIMDTERVESYPICSLCGYEITQVELNSTYE